MNEQNQTPGAPHRAVWQGSERVHIHHVLSTAAIFAKASKTSRDTLTEHARSKSVPEGAALIAQDTAASELLVMVRGSVQVWRRGPYTAFLSLGFLGPGDAAGLRAIFRDEVHTETATALSTTDAVAVPAAIVHTLMESDPGLGTSLRSILVHERAEAEARIASQLFRTVEGRLAEFLLHAADRFGVAVKEGTRIEAPLTHLEIARHIGSTRETVTLTLGSLRREGLVKTAGRRLIVSDGAGLAARAA